ncbi:MAG: AAA family ATPase [Gammaproteobacteria bacterium]
MMKPKLKILISSRARLQVEYLELMLKADPGVEVQTRVVVNGHFDPLYGVDTPPDILVLDLSQSWETELRELLAHPERPQLIVIVPADDNGRVIRMAMQAGARDYFTHPVERSEILASVQRIAEELGAKAQRKKGKGHLTAIINAKGGSGASFLACNVAHCMASHLHMRTALLDMDMQFGTLPLYLDLTPRDGVVAALADADQLDTVALEGHMLKHPSGLRLLASMSEELALPWEIPEDRLDRLLGQVLGDFEHVVVDLPRQFDPVCSRIMERAEHLLIVMQQGITHLRDAKRMVRVATRDLAIPNDRIHLVVNRYDKNNPVSCAEIQAALKPGSLVEVPNDYRRVSEAINLGVPLCEGAPGAAATKAIIAIAERLAQRPKAAGKGKLGSVFNQLFLRI